MLSWKSCNNDNVEALPGTVPTLSLLYPPTDDSNGQQLKKSHMECYCDHTWLVLRLL